MTDHVPVAEHQCSSVAVSSLHAGDSPRLAGVNSEHVHVLARTGAELPPLLVHRKTMRIIDGMHRLSAAKLMGINEIKVQYFDGTAEEAFLLAVKANVSHGLPLTLADRRAAAERILNSQPWMSNRAIASIVGLADRTVAAIRDPAIEEERTTARVGRDGRVRPLNSAEGRRLAAEVIRRRPDASLRTIAAEAGISVGTARDVRRRMMAGDHPIPARWRSDSDEASPECHVGPPLSPASPRPDADPKAVLDRLRRDPQLRYTERGRAFLRWLGQRALGPSDLPAVLSSVPPHCAVTVSQFARSCGQAWLSLAAELDRHGG